jgi:hypothetical protein
LTVLSVLLVVVVARPASVPDEMAVSRMRWKAVLPSGLAAVLAIVSEPSVLLVTGAVAT